MVEDNAGIRELFREFFAEEGYKVRLAQDGEEALLRARDEVFDLVLTDLIMPHTDGIQLLNKVRNMMPDAKVIVMSATDDLRTAARVKELGACDFITKPFRFEKVLQKVKEALEDGNEKGEIEQ